MPSKAVNNALCHQKYAPMYELQALVLVKLKFRQRPYTQPLTLLTPLIGK